jgi:MFS family permease
MNSNILRALSEKSFASLWIGEIFTQISGNLFNFFLILIVYKLTQSNTAVSIAVLSFTIPAILFGSVAGVFVDRWNKKRILIISNVFRAVLLVLMIFYLHNLIMIYFFSFLIASLTQIFIPAETPVIPLTVRPKYLLSANALYGFGIFGSIFIAYVASGPLLLFVGQMWTLVILSVMLLIGALFISAISLPYVKIKKTKKGQQRFTIFREIKHTFQLIFRVKAISHSLFLLALSQILILLFATIAPGYSSQILKISVEDFPLLFVAPAAIGMIFGAFFLVQFIHDQPKDKVITIGIFLSGIAMLLLPYGSKVASRDFVNILNIYLPHFFKITVLHIMMVIAFLLGFANSFVFIPANTLLQEKTTDEFRGKIYGFLNTIVGVFSLVPILLVGGLSDLLGVNWVIVGIGGVLVLLGIFRLVFKQS